MDQPFTYQHGNNMKQFKLSQLQDQELSNLILKRNQSEMAIGNLIKFIVDANGDQIKPNGNWQHDKNGILHVDVIAHNSTIKEKIKKK